MYQLLLVDDERYIVNWLYELFETYFIEQQMEVNLLKAYSAKEALQVASHTKLDVVVSDIRMPGMDGFALVDRIKLLWERVKVVFLSAHDEFEYVYRSIRYDEVSYLLKTEDDEMILNTVLELLEQVKQEDEEVNTLLVQKNMLLLLQQREFLRQLLHAHLPITAITQEKLLEYGIDFSINQPVVLLFGKLNILQNRTEEQDWFCCLNEMNLLIKNHVSPRVRVAQYDYKEGYLLWLLQPSKEENSLFKEDWGYFNKFIMQTLDTVQGVLNSKFSFQLSFFYYGKPLAWELLLPEILQIEINLDYYLGQESGVILTQDSLTEDLLAPLALQDEHARLHKAKVLQLDRLTSCLRQGNQKDFTAAFAEISQALTQCHSMHDSRAIQLYFSIALSLLAFINDSQLSQKISFKVGLIHLTNLQDFSTWQVASDYLKKIGESIFALQDNEKQRRHDSMIAEIFRFIEANLDGDLSLTHIAEHVNYNPSYLSRFFKQVTGRNLYQYINELRLSQAAKQLASSNETVYTVAKKTGFDSSQYFSTTFKKTYGVTPQEYRENNRV